MQTLPFDENQEITLGALAEDWGYRTSGELLEEYYRRNREKKKERQEQRKLEKRKEKETKDQEREERQAEREGEKERKYRKRLEIRELLQKDKEKKKERNRRKRLEAKKIMQQEREKRKKKGRTRQVYFIQEGTDGPIKIGVSLDVVVRLGMMQTGNPRELRLIATYPGSWGEEKELHNRFRDLRIMGEWFEPSEALIRWIQEKSEVGLEKVGKS